MKIVSILLLCTALGALALAQIDFLKKTTFEEQSSLTMSNGTLDLTILPQGASLASLVLAGDSEKMSPLWDPLRMARETGATARFNPITGHFVCVDGFGQPSQEERAAGLQGHGEAHSQMFEQTRAGKEGTTSMVTLTAKLPIVQENFTRTFRMVDGENVIYVESQLENLLGFDRPVNWAEHITVGSPFLESNVTVVDVSGSRSQTRPYQGGNNGLNQRRLVSAQDFTWPMAPGLDGKSIDIRYAPENPHYLDHATTLLDPTRNLEWVTAFNPNKRLMLGYVFKRAEYPWVQYWGNYPATGKFARGIEISTQPYDVSRHDAVSTGSMFGTPTYRWLPAKSKIESRFLLFYTRVPDGFRKIDDVRIENGRIVIEDRGAKKQITLAASLPL